jgi:MFS family permease
LLATAFLWFWPGELRWLFALTMIPGMCLIALIALGLKDPPSAQSGTKTSTTAPLTLAPFDGRFRLFLVSLVIFTLGNSSDAFLLVRAGELGVTTAWLPILWGALHVIKGVGNWWVGPLVEKIGSRRLIIVGWSIYSIVYLLFAFADQAWHAWALFLLYGLFYACTESSEKVLVVDLVGQERRGAAFGWFHAAIGIATLPASLLFGELYDRYGSLAAFGTSAGLALVASFVLMTVRPSRLLRDAAEHLNEPAVGGVVAGSLPAPDTADEVDGGHAAKDHADR